MNREQILATVLKHLCNIVDGTDKANIDPARSMKDYGANSLDLVEVVSATMRELKLKVSRSDLGKVFYFRDICIADNDHQAAAQWTGHARK